jgi:preprotein translocase subunit SecE
MTIMVLIMTTLLSVFFLGIDQILGRTVKFLLSLAA